MYIYCTRYGKIKTSLEPTRDHRKDFFIMEIINDKKMYDVNEVSQMTTVSVRTVEKYLRSGKMHGVKIRGHWLVSETSINDFLDGKTWNDDQV